MTDHRLQGQIDAARDQIRRNKRSHPYLYPEWTRLKEAEEQLHRAAIELAAAQLAWDQLGNQKPAAARAVQYQIAMSGGGWIEATHGAYRRAKAANPNFVRVVDFWTGEVITP